MASILQTAFLNCIVLNENFQITNEISLKYVP